MEKREEETIKATMMHPLLNPESPHYDRDGVSAIEALERKFTLLEALAWCRGNIFKYEWRKDSKGQKESDEKKLATFRAYEELLEEVRSQGAITGFFLVTRAYHMVGLEVQYR